MKKINILSRLSFALIFFYHGLVPKIIFKSKQEVMMNEKLMPFLSEDVALYSTGVVEIIYALCLIIFIKNKYLVIPGILFASIATVALLLFFPQLFTQAFNPFSINLAVAILGIINYISYQNKEVCKN